MSENKIYKKKVVDPCPNKLFITWIEEMKKNAKKNKQKSYYSFKKALHSIKLFPLVLNSGKECMILDGFGKTICELLDKKLHELAKSQDLSVSKALKKANKEYLYNSKSLKSFVPDKNSASYALLFGLYKIQSGNNDENYTGSVKKDVVQSSLKFFAMSSDTELLWRGMSKLVKNNLVLLDRNRYRLTSSGTVLYEQLYEERAVEVNNKVGINTNCDYSCPMDDEESEKAVHSDKIQFYYCKFLAPNTQDFVNLKSDAASKMINDKQYFRIKVKASDLIFCDFDYLYDLDILFENDNFVFVFISDCDAPMKGCFVDDKSDDARIKLSSKPVINGSAKMTRKPPKRTKFVEMEVVSSKIKKCPKTTNSDNKEILADICRSQPLEIEKEILVDEKVLYQMVQGSFEVILIVDNRESFGKGKLKVHLCPDLIKKGVKLETRPLSIGDFLWIARDETGREAVLDFIVERKTYADLSTSITDGRLKDQRWRMKRSGITRIMYILEKCKGMKSLSLPLETLHQSLTNSQIHANCDVRITENGSDTIDYLHLLTRKICGHYANKSLNVYRDCIPRNDKCLAETNSGFPAIDYVSFSESSQKTKPILISEMFAKHVNCINGITVERAKALVDNYPTPRLLIEAFSQCESEAVQQSLLTKLRLMSEKPFGLKQSKTIHAAYCRL